MAAAAGVTTAFPVLPTCLLCVFTLCGACRSTVCCRLLCGALHIAAMTPSVICALIVFRYVDNVLIPVWLVSFTVVTTSRKGLKCNLSLTFKHTHTHTHLHAHHVLMALIFLLVLHRRLPSSLWLQPSLLILLYCCSAQPHTGPGLCTRCGPEQVARRRNVLATSVYQQVLQGA